MDTEELKDSEDVETEATGDDLYEGWDDDLDSEDAEVETTEEESEETDADDEDESEEADQPEDETEEESAEDSEGTEETAEPEQQTAEPQKYTLKHLDETVEVTAEEMIPLAQKGMDYDRIREERDSMKANYAELMDHEEFLKELVKTSPFETVEELIQDTLASVRVKTEKDNGNSITKAHALSEIKAERAGKSAHAAKEEKAEETTEATKPEPQQMTERDLEIQSFFNLFDKQEDIPQFKDLPLEVRTEFEKTGRLVKAWFNYQMKQKETEKEIIKQNTKNKERSTGSRKTSGKGVTKDPIYEGWDD